MPATLTLDDYIAEKISVPPSGQALPFDRMMFDVCGEANHVRAAARRLGGDVRQALKAFDRACHRIYADPQTTVQRKFTLASADWVLKAAYLWHIPGIREESATRFFDAWQRERSLEVLSL